MDGCIFLSPVNAYNNMEYYMHINAYSNIKYYIADAHIILKTMKYT